MRTEAGSWRFSYDVGQMPNAVIYVRDALGLPVQQAAGIPPRLLGGVPDRSELLDMKDESVAASAWAAWWQAVGAIEARMQLGGEPRSGVIAEHSRILDPGTPPALGDSIRDATKTLYEEGCEWFNGADPARGRREEELAGLEWNLIRDAVEAVAAEAQVSTAPISAALSVVLVDGVWGAVVAPGFAWCSLGAAHDPRVGPEIIRAAMKSGLKPA